MKLRAPLQPDCPWTIKLTSTVFIRDGVRIQTKLEQMGKKLNLLIVAFITLGHSFCNAQYKQISDFVPNGYSLFEEYKGDLNNDGLEDIVLIVKDTKKENIVNQFDVEVDRNRRGIIVLFNKENNYELVVENLKCFSSENEDWGVYFPPELWIDIENNNLKIYYSHGRYGYWEYILRYDKSAFTLIGYESGENPGPVTRYNNINNSIFCIQVYLGFNNLKTI